jgi:hypothetical protein
LRLLDALAVVQAFLYFTQLVLGKSTPWYNVSRFGLHTIVKMILAAQGTGDLEVRVGHRGSNRLHAASAFGSVEVVETYSMRALMGEKSMKKANID